MNRISVNTLYLQWDEAFKSVSGGRGSTSDYDFYLTAVKEGAPEVLVNASPYENVGGDALEFLDIKYSELKEEGFNTVRLYAVQADAPEGVETNKIAGIFMEAKGVLTEAASPTIRGADGMIAAPQFNGPTVIGHQNAENTLTVGSARFDNTPAFGALPAKLNPDSAKGAFDIHIDADGNRLDEPVARRGVDVVGPDSGNNTFFGRDLEIDDDALPNFPGTSAAAPHIAGVVALMLEANPDLDLDQIKEGLSANAVPILTDSYGRDVDQSYTGAGFVDAVSAVEKAIELKESHATITGTSNSDQLTSGVGGDVIVLGGGRDTLTGTVHNFFGDRVEGFGKDDEIIFSNSHIARSDITVTAGTAILAIDSDGDGLANGRFTVTGDVTGGLHGSC
jgi:hypothetical protein